VVLGKSDIMKSLDDPGPPGAPTATYAAEKITVRQHCDMAIVAFRLIQKLSGGTTNRYRNTATFLNRNGGGHVGAWQATRIEAGFNG
jgi:hypothetical protein